MNVLAESFVTADRAGLLHAGPDPVETSRAINAMLERYCSEVFVRRYRPVRADDAAAMLTELTFGALRVTR